MMPVSKGVRSTSRRDFSRAEFLRVSTAALVGLGSCSALQLFGAPEPAPWLVACRDLHLKVAAQKDCWTAMKTLGAEGVEVGVSIGLACPNLFNPSRQYSLSDEKAVEVLGQDATRAGRQITAFMLSNQFDERLEKEIECTKAVVQAAKRLGVGAIRIDLRPGKTPAGRFLPFAIEVCKRLCSLVEGTRVRFGIENHGNVTNDPAFLAKLFEAVDSPHLGLTLDCANFYWFGHPLEDLYGIYERFASRVVHTHCKSIAYPEDKRNVRREMGWEYAKYNCPIDKGDIDFKRVAAILRKAGYTGDLCLEDESLGKFAESERADVVRRQLAALKQLR